MAQILIPTEGRDRGPRIRGMFDRVARRYDLLNNVMSLGQHRRWRRIAARLAGIPRGRILDLATGTGDFALELACYPGTEVVGLDFSVAMLAAARVKLARLPSAVLPASAPLHQVHELQDSRGAARVPLVQADALALPFPDQTFDGLTSAFLLRNLADLGAGLAEMHRVLKPQGWIVALDITHPRGVLGRLVRAYFRAVVPLLGGLLSGEWSAYRYLPASVGPFPEPESLSGFFRAAGFHNVSFVRLGLGSVAVHVGRA